MTKSIASTLLTLAVGSTLASSQALTAIRPTSPSAMTDRIVEAARPLLGYAPDEANVLRSVVGSANRPQWGDPLSLPESTAVTFLPPRQEYGLLVSEAGLSVARLSRSAVYPGSVIPNAMSRPEQVSFSPSGEAVALFSSVEGRMEVLTSVGSKAQVAWSIPVASPSDLRQFTLSDDGALLVAMFANQPSVYSWRGSTWQLLSTSYRADAWTFLPHSHNLVLSDRSQKAIIVLLEAEKAPVSERLLATGDIDASLLSANKEGSKLLAVASGTSASWSIDLRSGVIEPLPGKDYMDSITLLRDGQTFLVSTKGSPLVVRLGSDTAESAATKIYR